MSELSTIPYDAPLSFREPSYFWTRYYSARGASGTLLSRKDVPFTDLSGKWIIISGSNNGIGREAAIFFAQCGANLILACRSPPPHERHPNDVVQECLTAAKSRGYEKSTVEWWEIDMTKFSTVEAFAQRWLDTGRALDILCNNAGMGSNPGGLGNVLKTGDGLEFVHQVNFAAHVLLTLRLLPSIQKAKEPRIVCTTSCLHYHGKYRLSNWDGSGCKLIEFYANNKLYFQIWVAEMNQRLLRNEKLKHITINGVHPGFVNTGIWNFQVGKGPFAFIEILIKTFLGWLAGFVGVTAEQGSYCIQNAATSLNAGPNPTIQGVGASGGKGGGRYFNRIWEEVAMPHAADPDARLRVWRKLNEELGLEQKGLLEGLGN
jgi:NAD(P)-dependent dehydrogenase (short-subunit alcohol dehydrogenase family)